jgi:hypothetical protein
MGVDNTMNCLAAGEIIAQTASQESTGPLFYGSHQHPKSVEAMAGRFIAGSAAV